MPRYFEKFEKPPLPGAHSICPQKQNQIRWSGRVGRSISVSVSVSFYSDDGFQPMQKELYNNNDKETE